MAPVKSITVAQFDTLAEAGASIDDYIDWSSMRRPNRPRADEQLSETLNLVERGRDMSSKEGSE